MTDQTDRPRRRAARLGAAFALIAGASGASVILTTAPAGATTCSGSSAVAGTCTTSGSFTLSAGALSLEAPASLSWAGTTTGFSLQEVDSTDTTFTAIDPTGTGAGWLVTAQATQFTGTGSSSNTLPTSTALELTGSTSSETATTAPSTQCATGSSCTLPSDTVSGYPITVVSDGTTTTSIFSSNLSYGLGAIVIGAGTGSHPVGWWVNVPSNAKPDTYTSTITLGIVSGP